MSELDIQGICKSCENGIPLPEDKDKRYSRIKCNSRVLKHYFVGMEILDVHTIRSNLIRAHLPERLITMEESGETCYLPRRKPVDGQPVSEKPHRIWE